MENAIVPEVFLVDNQPVTTSLAVARHFEKEHFNVLRDIKHLLDECPADFTHFNFEASEYADSTGRSLPMYHLRFDGFMLLVMGYTGKKAMAIKIAYIEAFNAMRAKLQQNHYNSGYDSENILRSLLTTIDSIAKTSLATSQSLDSLAKTSLDTTQSLDSIAKTMLATCQCMKNMMCAPEDYREEITPPHKNKEIKAKAKNDKIKIILRSCLHKK